MGKLNKLLVVLLLVAFFISGCSPKDNAQVDNNNTQEQPEKDKSQKIVEDFKNKYSAVELELYNEGHVKFSSEIIDNFKEKNIYSSLFIEDIFYSDNSLYMYAEIWDDSKFLFKITQEQYSAIQSMYDNGPTGLLHAVFTLDNIEPMLPSLSADFNFCISAPDDIYSDEETSVYFDARIMHGTLVDIIDVQ